MFVCLKAGGHTPTLKPHKKRRGEGESRTTQAQIEFCTPSSDKNIFHFPPEAELSTPRGDSQVPVDTAPISEAC
jgi:hypothetical protein